MIAQVPQLLVAPRPAIIERLVPDPPPAVAAFHHVDLPGPIAGVGVVVAGPQVPMIVKSEILWIAKSGGEYLQMRSIGVAAQHATRIGILQNRALARLHVESAVADAEIEPPVRPEGQPVQIVPDEGNVHAEAAAE